MGATRLVLDSCALSALAEEKSGVRRYLERAIEEKTEIAVPTVVIAESTTGSARDAALNNVLRVLEPTMVELSEELAREAGALRYRARRPLRDTIDAIIVATADASAGSAILTADAGDMAALAAVRRRSPVLLLGHH